MSTLNDIQNTVTGIYWSKDKFFLHVRDKSIAAFDKADKRRNKIKTKEDFLKYQESSKKAFLKSMGKIPYDNKLPLNAEVVKSEVYDGIRIENVLFQSRKNVFVTATFYVPENATGKLPGILMQCGHSNEGRLFFGYRRVCTTIAKSGFCVLAIDPLGQGERKSYPELPELVASPTKEHQYCGNQCLLAGSVLTKYFIADAMRGVDYLQSRVEVDADKIGATGSSGGGTMTAVMGVVDDRIKAAAPGTFITTRRDYMNAGSHQDSEQIWPGTSKDLFDHYELVSCFCPKPYLILGVKSDFFCREGTEKVYNKEKEFYKLFGKEDDMRIFWDDSTHAYTPALAKAAAEFFNDVLKGKKVDAEITEPIEDKTLLYSTKSGQLVADKKGVMPVFDANKAEFSKKKCKNAKNILLKNIYNDRKECALNVRHMWKDTAEEMYAEFLLWFTQEHLPCRGVLFKAEDKKDKKLPVTICLWSGGTDKIVENASIIKKITNSGKAALVVDLTAMGKSAPNPMSPWGSAETSTLKLNCDLLFLGDSLCAIRAFELIKTFDMLKEEFDVDDVDLYTIGNYCVYPEILKVIGIEKNAHCENPVTVHDIITNKIYNNDDITNISMPGIGLYLK